MKFKLIIEPSLLKPQYQHTLHKTLLVCPDHQQSSIKDLLKFAYESFEFALKVNSADLYLCTDDDFLLPPNAQVSQALDVNQVIKMASIVNKLKVDKEAEPKQVGLFNIPKIEQPVVVPQLGEVQKAKAVQKNRRKIKPKGQKAAELLGKRTVLEIASKSSSESSSSSDESSSSSSSSSSSESESEKEEVKKGKKAKIVENQKKREVKSEEKKQTEVKPNVKSIAKKIRNEFKEAFISSNAQPKKDEKKTEIKVIQPNQVNQQKTVHPPAPNQTKASLQDLKVQSKSLERPYLNQFDHLLPSKQGGKHVQFQPETIKNPEIQTKEQELYDSLFGAESAAQAEDYVDYDEEQDPKDRKREKKERQKFYKECREDDEQLYNKYTEVFTKDSKNQQKMAESIFTSGGMLEVLNQRNLLIIINLDDYVYISPENVQSLKQKSDFKAFFGKVLKTGREICFRVTEPCLQTFVPKVSEPKIGTIQIVSLEEKDATIQIELRQDFRLLDQEQDEQLMMAFPDSKYQGEGLYQLNLSDFVGFYVKIEDQKQRKQILETLESLVIQSPPQVIAPKQPITEKSEMKSKKSSNQNTGVANFMQTKIEDINQAIRRQVEYYFGDQNFPKDKYLQKKCSEHPEGYISLREIMSFNKMRKYTKSNEQVIKAIEGSKLVELSADKKFIRKIETKTEDDSEEGAIQE